MSELEKALERLHLSFQRKKAREAAQRNRAFFQRHGLRAVYRPPYKDDSLERVVNKDDNVSS
jgi:phage-related protein